MAKSTKPDIVRKCLTCAFAHLVQYYNNPVLAECPCKVEGDREVANSPTRCPLYMESNLPKEIEHRYTYQH